MQHGERRQTMQPRIAKEGNANPSSKPGENSSLEEKKRFNKYARRYNW